MPGLGPVTEGRGVELTPPHAPVAPPSVEHAGEPAAQDASETPEERKKKIQKLSNWLSSLKKS